MKVLSSINQNEDVVNKKYVDDNIPDLNECVKFNNYASNTKSGVVKVDNTTITIDSNGVISSVGGGGTSNHAELQNLDYNNSGHTGFAPTASPAFTGTITKSSQPVPCVFIQTATPTAKQTGDIWFVV